jgi:predicted HTH transcriptional regulator
MPGSELERLSLDRRETRRVEFKGPLLFTELATKAEIVKAALAMANTRDGGVFLGVDRQPGTGEHLLTGLTQEQAASYNINDLTSTVNSYASPTIELALESLEVEGRRFVAISFQEFSDYPIMCSRNLEVNNRTVVVKGRLYCRSRRMPESTEVQSPEDLREIVELAIAKGIAMAGKMRTQAPHPRTPRRDHVNGS